MSRPLRLDFVTAPTRGWQVGGWVALAALVAALLAVADHGQRQHERLAAAQQQVERWQQRARPSTVPRPQAVDADTGRRLQQANQVIEQLAVPWEALLDSVEAAPRRGISLLQLMPNPKEQTLRLSAEAATLPQALAYAEQLARQPQLAEVHLVSHDTVQRDGAAVVAFSLQARWRQP